MNLHQFLLVLRARWWAVLITALVVVGTTAVVTFLMPKKYTAAATVIVDFKSPDVLTGSLLPVLPGYMATQVDVIRSHRVAVEVVRNLHMTQTPGIREQFLEATEGKGTLEDWLANRIAAGVDVEPSKESSVIAITYDGNDPKFAAVLANAFAQAYIETNLALRVEPAKQTAQWFEQRVKTLREDLETSQTKLSAYQRRMGIVASDERLDVESSRLAELSTQAVALQAEASQSENRLQQAERFLATGGQLETLPEVLSNPFIQALNADLLRAEAKQTEVSQSLGVNHPQYLQARAEIEELRRKLKEEVRKVTAGFANAHRINERRLADVHAALAAQKAKVLGLKGGRDELNVLLRDVDTSQRAYDLGTQRLTQTSLESEVSQTNVIMLTPASEPLAPSSPRVFLNILVSLFLGGLLGLGLALGLEAIDGRVRSVDDFAGVIQAPVLGRLERARTKTRRRARLPVSRPRIEPAV